MGKEDGERMFKNPKWYDLYQPVGRFADKLSASSVTVYGHLPEIGKTKMMEQRLLCTVNEK